MTSARPRPSRAGPRGDRLPRRPPRGQRQGAGLGRAVGEASGVAGDQELQGDRPRQQQERDRGDQLRPCAWPPSLPIAEAALRARPSSRQARKQPRDVHPHGHRARSLTRPRAQRRGQRPARRRAGIASDQRRPRPARAATLRRPERLRRRGRAAPPPRPPAAGTEPRRSARPRRSPPPCGLRCWRSVAAHAATSLPRTRDTWCAQRANRNESAPRQMFASIQIRQIAAIEAPSRTIQSQRAAAAAEELVLPAISSAIIPAAP